ncbi:MAG: DUF3306 domain-containing protein [Polaromonas sp.]
MADEPQGFLGRWSSRKTDVLKGRPLEEPAAIAKPVPVVVGGVAESAPLAAMPEASEADKPAEKMLSLDDVRLLTADSDFTPFMARDVGPEVRNAAMKKLFTDPHYNVMDGLDTYIGDYSKSDPIPESMLRQMVGAKLLRLFDDDEKDDEKEAENPNLQSAPLLESANSPTSQTVAQSDEPLDLNPPNSPSPEYSSQPAPLDDSGASQPDHAHTHLRLQPDHAATAPDAGHGNQ